jgi:hypothetical protein
VYSIKNVGLCSVVSYMYIKTTNLELEAPCSDWSWVYLTADGQLTSSSWYGAPLWGPWPDFILIFSLVTIVFVLPAGRLLWREDGSVTYSAIADWSGHWGPITIHYHLIWDCVSSSSPLTSRRDYGGVILTRLHTRCLVLLHEMRLYNHCHSQPIKWPLAIL